MKINGLNGTNTNYSGMNMMQSKDSVSKNIQNQIANAQKALQELSANKDMSIEEKMKKRQEIQQQINELNQQLRQHQMEQRKEQQAKKSSIEDMLSGTKKVSPKAGKQGTGLSQESMKAMISADSAMKQAQIQGSVATKMEGRAGVLESEIKLDMARGDDVTKKKEELAEVQQKAMTAESAQMNTLADVNMELEEEAKVEQQEEKTKDKDKEKNIIGTEEKSDVNIEVNKDIRPENNSTELLKAVETSSLEPTTYKHVDVYL